MSVIQLECIKKRGVSVSEHIRTYYAGIAGEPIVFLIIEDRALPVGYTIRQTPSDPMGQNDDKCHHEIFGVSNKNLKKLRKRPINEYHVCDNGGHRNLTEQDVARWR